MPFETKMNLFANRILSTFFFCGLITFSFSQEIEEISIEWLSPTHVENEYYEYDIPTIKDQQLDGIVPNFYWRKEVSSLNITPEISILRTAPANALEIEYLNKQGIVVAGLDYQTSVSKAGLQNVFALNLFPFIMENGSIKRITQISISFIKGKGQVVAFEKDFVTNSVLQNGTGEWYKISVTTDGIYKIDKSFLQELGINVESINPQSINIFGNGDGKLPELNSIPRTDDLAKNDILVIGEGDGVFDDGDYILFYGWGPHRWYDNGVEFYQDRHIYSDVSCYFININPSETPARISTIANSVNVPNVVVNSHSYYDVHESDLVSLVNGGQRWYGELFDSDLSKTFAFNVPNIDTSVPADFEVSLASNASNSGGTAQTYSVNGTQIFTTGLPASSEFGRSVSDMTFDPPTSSMIMQIDITRNSPDVLTYLDKITLNARRQLSFTGTQFNFRDLESVGVGNVADYTISNFSFPSGFVWEVTDRHQPKLVQGSVVGTNYSFTHDSDSLRHYVASNGLTFLTPSSVGPVSPQDLHGLPQADYLIVTHPNFKGQADRLADLHRANGLIVHVATTNEIYNEFSSGMQDATAIRMFAKMFWDRGSIDPTTRPKNLLLFGDGTYDPKNRVPNNNNYILTYQMLTSENHISAMPSDDYFGLLDDSEAIFATDQVDIGIGRLLISTNQMAKEQVDKIEHYMKNGSNLYNSTTTNCNCTDDSGSSTFGDWRTKYVQIADDEEGNYFLNFDVEPQYKYVTDSFPEMNCEKIYTDAYTQIATAGGERYPEVNEAIDAKMNRGALVLNYVGHGGEVGWAEERILTVPMIQDWRNIDNMPLMVSATCEFTKFDDPDRVSAGEWASINPYGGAIALMTTTRSVFFGTNTQIGRKFFENVFVRESDYTPRTFGEIIMHTKNAVGGDNKRSFTLIGDPALKLAMPHMRVVTDSINGMDPAITMDTINALSLVTIKGHLEDYSGGTLSAFNGTLYPTVFDKKKDQTTLSNDGPVASPEYTFETQVNKVYAGKASIVNGFFEFSFVVPKDINYSIDFGKISYYAENQQIDAIGFDTLFYIGGIDPNGLNDNQGPTIDMYLNDESFVNGGLSDETPILIAKLFDQNGINTVGNGIGHDLIAILDGETGNPIVLNDFYTADLDSYQSGEIRYNFTSIEPGEHTLSLKVWDVNNNSSEASLNFIVQEKQDIKLEHVLNYPNPFTTSTEFFFEHNQVCNQLEAQVQIFTVSGRLVKTINEVVNTVGYRSSGIHWDGKDEFGDQLAKGVYVYRIKVKSPLGEIAEEIEKLVILR